MENNLKVLRKKLKLTLQELADRTGVSKSYIWELEAARVPRPGLNRAYAISKALSLPIQKVFPDTNEYETEVLKVRRTRIVAVLT